MPGNREPFRGAGSTGRDHQIGVVHQVAVAAGANFDGFDEACFAEGMRKDEIPKEILTAGRDRERLRRNEHEVRRTQRPAGGERQGRRTPRRIAVKGATASPFADQPDLRR